MRPPTGAVIPAVVIGGSTATCPALSISARCREATRSATIRQIFDHYGITYVVFQPDFWMDLPSMAAMQNYVYSDRFGKVAKLPISANVPLHDREIVIFKNNRAT